MAAPRGADSLVDRAARRLAGLVVAVSAEGIATGRQPADPQSQDAGRRAVMAAGSQWRNVLVPRFSGGAGTRDLPRYAQFCGASAVGAGDRLH